MKQKTELFLIEVTYDIDLCGETIIESGLEELAADFRILNLEKIGEDQAMMDSMETAFNERMKVLADD